MAEELGRQELEQHALAGREAAMPGLGLDRIGEQGEQGAEHLEAGSLDLQRRAGGVDGFLGQAQDGLQGHGDR